LMKNGSSGLGAFITKLSLIPELAPKVGEYVGRLSQLLGITDIELNIEEVTGTEKTIDIVVNIFNRVNSGGTKLSKGDLALAKICAEWPEARDAMKEKLKEWKKADYNFDLDWLLRSMNTVLTGEAKFQFLHHKSIDEISNGLARANKSIETCLNMISGRLGLDHDRVLFGRYAIPVMAHYLDKRNNKLTEKERDNLLFWYVQAGMWGRYSGSTESFIDKDLSSFEEGYDGLDRLIENLRLWHGSLRVEPGHFTGWSLGARFYPVLYMLTRMGESRDWGTGLPLKADLLGKMNRLEVHHIFPKAQLYKHNYYRSEVNAVANFCFLTKDTNLNISDQLPEVYFPKIETKHQGALASQWIPMDQTLWRIENYRDFLEARKILLAEETNKRLLELLHNETRWLEGQGVVPSIKRINIGITSDEEEKELMDLNTWMEELNLSKGTLAYDFSDQESGAQCAVFDLAWSDGIQEGLSQPVAVLLNETAEIISLASRAGFRCFTAVDDFKNYVKSEILHEN